MTAASARTTAAAAAVTWGGWASCGERSAVRMRAVRRGMAAVAAFERSADLGGGQPRR